MAPRPMRRWPRSSARSAGDGGKAHAPRPSPLPALGTALGGGRATALLFAKRAGEGAHRVLDSLLEPLIPTFSPQVGCFPLWPPFTTQVGQARLSVQTGEKGQ